MSASAFDHPWLSGLLGDPELQRFFSVDAELAELIAFEIALARAEGALAVIPGGAAQAIAERLPGFGPDHAAVRMATARDGVAVPELVRQLRAHIGPLGRYLHFGATSQDAIDTSLVRRLRPVLEIMEGRLGALSAALNTLAEAQGTHVLVGRTRMQEALPITAADKLKTWRDPMARHLARLAALRPRLLTLQLGGAVGTLDALGAAGPAVASLVAKELDLGLGSWHTQRDAVVELADWLALVAGTLGKLGADIALLAQMGEVEIAGGGGSSAMPHKHNPVAAEVLVSLARCNATLVSGMHQAQVHEQERSGAAWTLEWLLLPQMVVATGASLRLALQAVAQIVRLGKKLG